MAWRKLGQLFNPGTAARHPKLATHAANPLPVHIEDDIFRVFYSGRDAQQRSSIGAVDIDVERREIVSVQHDPVFEHGPEGSFYADGVSIGNCYATLTDRYILFMGWCNPKDAHWRGEIGRLLLDQKWRLSLAGDGTPFMALDAEDPISLSYPWVMEDEGTYRMWYGSTTTWDGGNGEMLHVIRQAISPDGEAWTRQATPVPWELGVAQAFSRPTVIRDESGFHMWFSYRDGTGRTYRIGRAWSENGTSWELQLDRAGIDVSKEGWDSQMIEYPFVFDHRGSRYMLYNGNGYGATGFGLAILEQ